MDTVVVYSTQTSSRLNYVLDWLFKERLQVDYRITTHESDIKDLPFFVSYGAIYPQAISIPDSGLLWEDGIKVQQVQTGMWANVPVLFAINGNDPDKRSSLPFDIFSGVFYLLSRYEEYNPYRADKHNRYPPEHSVLYRNGWLTRPLVDEWVSAFAKLMQTSGADCARSSHFIFRPTYDIDMAYSYLHKGLARIAGGYVRALLKGNIRQMRERTQVLKSKEKDPFDAFRWLRQLHKQYDSKPVYFILCALKTTPFDKNIHPRHPAMIRVIKNLVKEGDIGIHPSYYSNHGVTLSKEKKTLEQIAGKSIAISRQHYMRMKMPDTYRLLLNNAIKEDYSMGYGSQIGFRAGTGSSFLWYDLVNESITPLRIHPFCFMDTAAHYEMKLSATAAFDQLNAMRNMLEQTGSVMTTIFHNFSLGTASEWKGWRQAYEHFLQIGSATD